MRHALVVSAVAAGALALPAAAFAHAALLKTVPEASVTLSQAPGQVSLTYSEAVEPRFAIVSVTDAAAHQEASGPPRRSPTDPDTLIVPLKHVPEGWYLVYWRVISVDGHPVRGAFTFAVGPNPGPAPQFVIPSTSETAATPRLVTARWVVFLTVMAAIGLAALRLGTARPVVRRVSGTNLRAVTVTFAVASAAAIVAIPVYALLATADFALRSFFSFGALLPLIRASAFGRGMIDLWITFALFALAAAIAILVDRPERPRRSVAELVAGAGALVAAAAVLLVPGLSGHAAQTAPRGLSVFLDWLHLSAGSIWIGGLIGLLVLWRSLPVASRVAGLVVAVPRFSNTALVSVLALIGSGTGASLLHLPTLGSLWQTSYGEAVLAKIALLALAIVLAAVNLLRVKPRLGHVEVGPAAARLLRRLVAGESLLVTGAILAAAILSSLPPPSKALAEVGRASAHVGPGPVSHTVEKNGYTFAFGVTPNKAAVPDTFSVRITKNGRPVQGAEVVATFAMLDMEMQNTEHALKETSPGVYTYPSAPALVMVGHWGISYEVTPAGGQPLTVLLVDKANG